MELFFFKWLAKNCVCLYRLFFSEWVWLLCTPCSFTQGHYLGADKPIQPQNPTTTGAGLWWRGPCLHQHGKVPSHVKGMWPSMIQEGLQTQPPLSWLARLHAQIWVCCGFLRGTPYQDSHASGQDSSSGQTSVQRVIHVPCHACRNWVLANAYTHSHTRVLAHSHACWRLRAPVTNDGDKQAI